MRVRDGKVEVVSEVSRGAGSNTLAVGGCAQQVGVMLLKGREMMGRRGGG